MAFFFYLKALNLDISMMIQCLRGSTLLDVYDLEVQAEKNLIDVGRLAPRPPMLVFPKILNQVLEPVASSTFVPQSMYVNPRSQQASTPSSSALATEVNDMKNLLRSFFNEIINLKSSQIPSTRPPFQQNFQGNRPPYQQNQYANNQSSLSQTNG